MAEPKVDKRANRRLSLKLPVVVNLPPQSNGESTVETKDVSSRGVFFYLDTPVKEGSPIEFTLTLPPEITLTDSIRVRCHGKVLRVVDKKSGEKVGIAAAIEQFDFLS